VRRWPWWAIVFLVVQVAVPLAQLARPRPARFGWQMYAGISQPLAFTAVQRDGSLAPVQLDLYIIRMRTDIDLIRYLPPAICARTGAVAVRYRVIPEPDSREVPCPR
jgi:hypothetical protein